MPDLWHGSNILTLALDPKNTRDGGLHVGSRDQASMRNSAVLYRIQARPAKIRRCRDRGDGWTARIRDARARGFEAIVYLNRYEGIPASRIEMLATAGKLAALDRLSDKEFSRLVPEASDSFILLTCDAFEVLHTELRRG